MMQNRPLNMIQNAIINDFMNLYGGFQGSEGKNEYLKNHDISGRENPNMFENIENYSNHVSKGSRSMFVRQLDICFQIVNKVVKEI